MSEYSNYIERDNYAQALNDIIEEYIQNIDEYTADAVLAVNTKTMEIELGNPNDFSKEWATYPIQDFIRDNKDNSAKESDIDATYMLASSYFFVR